YADGQLTRTEVIGLFRSATDGGQVSATEVRDLRNIVANSIMPASVKSLSQDVLDARPTAANMNQLIDKWFYGKDRPSLAGFPEISYQPVSGSLFVSGASAADIQQGRVGDCYLLAALGAVADKLNTVINTMFTDNMDGTWAVRFYKLDGSRYIEDWVTVDNQLPVNSAGFAAFENFGSNRLNPSNELWPALAEKAYAQFARGNSYAALSGGWPSLVFGQVTGRTAISSFDPNAIAALINYVSRGDAVVVYRYMDPARTQGHAYFVKSYSNGIFQLHNPWGAHHLSLDASQIRSQCYGFAVATRV
ncbi:MAG: hypothetical protein EBR88_08420, partial [Betaproteobacteria bacterium]|nr:hypothetical protein [Betaproteobacteria bacterium]